ncbi:cell division topological specificity factor MinE [Marinospirillum perlucidum]|uniref:cell division topological specificity factor MinE n=1 Tax=Marinospirillum perlucidum TaxID=1982602 RepID=UPI000DF4909C|nr:cell division topological specificity factor MinE [Marinospirillum perlucidum]
MKLTGFFQRGAPASASAAKERLKILLAHERSFRSQPEFLPRMQQDLVDVVRRYISVSSDQVQVDFNQHDMISVLEINVTFPEEEFSKVSN